MKQYKFISRSSLSFCVQHKGSQRYINFSPAYRNLSFYITSDAELAEKIRRHRWFKEGRIKEQVVEVRAAQSAPTYQPASPKAPKPYSILGRTMVTSAPKPVQFKQESSLIPSFPEEDQNPKPHQQEREMFPADSVTSFMEAKEFFIQNYGIERSQCANKAMLEALCMQYGVQFPNYQV